MRFFLVGRDRASGAVRIVAEQPYATRQEALDSLSSGAAGEAEAGSSDLFIVDLDALTPVVIYRPGVVEAATAIEAEPIADAWETSDAATTPLLQEAEPAPPEASADEDLAAALRRAASSMEAQGVVPAPTVEDVLSASAETPAHVEAAPYAPAVSVEPASTPEPAFEPATVQDSSAAPVPGLEPEPVAFAPVFEDDLDADALAGELDALAAANAPANSAMGAAASSKAPIAAEAPASPAPAPVPDAWPWEPEPASEPLSLSDAPEPPALTYSVQPVTFDEPVPMPLASEAEPARPVPAPILDTMPAVVERPLEAAASDAAAIDEAIASLLQPVPADVKGYEGRSGAVDSYACSDCVYIETCPKAGQESPASCGSFQWKSV